MFRSEVEVKCGEFDLAYETSLCFFFRGNNLISVDTIEVPVKIANFRGSRCFWFGNVVIDAELVGGVVGHIPRMHEIDVRAKPVVAPAECVKLKLLIGFGHDVSKSSCTSLAPHCYPCM